MERSCVYSLDLKKYLGPTSIDRSTPILPVTLSFKITRVSCTRKQYSIMLGYAINIDGSPGITLDKDIIDISESEFQVGLTGIITYYR